MVSVPARLVRRSLVVAVLGCGLSACASSQEWTEWRSHSTHFASGEHMAFSLKNMGSTPRVKRQDQRDAAAQSWWGRPVIPRADQIFED
jgi:hypothetical protein